ncbi:hypothetical protein D3C72_1584800 [compost metagenome]
MHSRQRLHLRQCVIQGWQHLGGQQRAQLVPGNRQRRAGHGRLHYLGLLGRGTDNPAQPGMPVHIGAMPLLVFTQQQEFGRSVKPGKQLRVDGIVALTLIKISGQQQQTVAGQH